MNLSKLEIEGVGPYEEVDILGFDLDEKTFHFFSLTNTAATRDHKGRWLDDGTIVFGFEGMKTGKAYTEEIRIKVLDADELSIMEEDVHEGRVVSTIDVTLRRRNS